jgi:hypothetical protein
MVSDETRELTCEVCGGPIKLIRGGGRVRVQGGEKDCAQTVRDFGESQGAEDEWPNLLS